MPFRDRLPTGLFRHRDACLVVLTLLAMFLGVWFHSRVARLELAIAEATREADSLETRLEFLARDLKRSTRLAEVETRARRELDLVTPDPDQVVILHLDGEGRDEGPGLRLLVPDAYAGSRSKGRAR